MIDLSVIVLIYNMEDLLPRCLASLERQTKHGIEFVLVDDGSQDSSGKICDAWHPENHYVKVIHKANGGVVAGWMDGVNAASGRYVGFVDSDDYVDSCMYEKLWEPVQAHGVDISMCSHLYESASGQHPCESLLKDGLYEEENLQKLHTLIMPKLAQKYLSPSLCNKIFRKELFKSNFKYCDVRATIADDVSVVIPSLFASKSFYYQNLPLYHYVTREGSVTNTYKENMYFQHALLIKNLKRAVNDYTPAVSEEAFAMFVCAMGNQWLRMITKANIPRKERKKLLNHFCKDEYYLQAARKLQKQSLNKWARAYCQTLLQNKYWKYRVMIELLQIRNSLK